ncbi:MAG: sulfite exporter TauE/SafE family protein [Beijerinckiaceae bacterium]
MADFTFEGAIFLGSFLASTFAAALVAGIAGFAFGIVAAAAWLHVLTPQQSAALIIGYGLIVQGYAVWKLRRALSLARLWPFLVGGIPGIALGILILRWTNPFYVRAAIGAVLALYSTYGLARPKVKPVEVGALADSGIGFLNGLLGGMTGLAGIVIVIWSGLRGWPKDVQRAVFQPVGVATFAMSAIGLGAAGIVTTDVAKLFLLGLPVLIAGTWLGLKLYGSLDEAAFRKVVLALLLASGASLIFS